jgi:uncharacterized membrane protein YjjP (DUF1212 family)
VADEQLEPSEHEYEDALEPTHLIRRSDVVLKAGILMLGAGTSGLRVRELMQQVASTVGIQRLHADISFTSIVLTVRRRDTFRTQVGEIPNPGVNAHRIALLQNLGNELPERATVAEVDARLRAIEKTPRLYPQWVLVLLVALACASVAVLGNGGWRELVAVLPASGLAYWFHRRMGAWQLNHLAAVLISAAIASGLYVGFSGLLTAALGEPSPRTAAGFISACIFLIPGFPLVTAGLDLTRIDLRTGVPRLAYAAMVVLAITIGVWLVVALAGLAPDPVPPVEGNPLWLWTATVLAGFFAVFGWAAMFNSPPATAVASGVIAALGAVLMTLLRQAEVRPHVAAFVACFAMGLACAVVAHWFGMTKIIMTVPVLLVTIPGSSALRTLLYFDQADVVSAMESGVSTVLVAIAMIAGLAGARMLTDPEWAFTRPEPPTLALAKVRRLLAFKRPGRRPAKGEPDDQH